MNENKAVDVSKIKQGDRVLVTGAANWAEPEWGTVGYQMGLYGPKVYMDNLQLEEATSFSDIENGGADCYYAEISEIIQHIPANKVAIHEGKPVNVEEHGQPTVFASVVDKLHETISYLETMTGKKFEPTIQSFGLSAEGTYTDNNVTIRFVEKKKEH